MCTLLPNVCGISFLPSTQEKVSTRRLCSHEKGDKIQRNKNAINFLRVDRVVSCYQLVLDGIWMQSTYVSHAIRMQINVQEKCIQFQMEHIKMENIESGKEQHLSDKHNKFAFVNCRLRRMSTHWLNSHHKQTNIMFE